jgi:thioredoxin 1
MKNIKKLAVLFVAFILTVSVAMADKGEKDGKAADQGIQFTEASWAAILKKAKAEKKIIFFDAYTTWCGPCKQLQKNVFTRSDVAEVFNNNFINVKFDMESGEGLKLAKKYPIECYPTLFFINEKGKVVKQLLGYQQPQDLIKVAKSLKKKDRAI